MNANVKTAVKYRLEESRKSIAVFYIVIIALTALLGFGATGLANGNTTLTLSVGGLESATIIFAFVLGVTSFRENFRMMLQNGLSRRTVFISSLISDLLLSVALSLIAAIVNGMAALLISERQIVFISLMQQVYSGRYAGHGYNPQIWGESFLFFFIVFAAALIAGHCISVLYFRMNRAGRIAFSAGVPSFLFIVLPMFDAIVTKGAITSFLGSTFLRAMGIGTQNPYMGMASSLIVVAVFSGIMWLLMRRAVVKD